MSDADANLYVIPPSAAQAVTPATTSAAIVKQTEIQALIGQTQQSKTAALVNAINAPKKTGEAPDLHLPESTGVAYTSPTNHYLITLARYDNVDAEKIAMYDFVLMKRAAYREASLVLYINSAFRTMEDQQRIWADRQLHPDKGVAAVPGTSNHQKGLSFDLNTGITFTDWKSGKVKDSPIHAWLVNNAYRFGFNQNDLGLLPDGRRFEPWHWTHANDGKLYGLTDPGSDLQGQYDDIVAAGQAANYTADGQPDWLRIVLKAGSDFISGWGRSASGAQAPRQSFYDLGAAQAALQGAEKVRRSAVQGESLALTTPAGFQGSVALYDFETGLWSDEGSENARGV